MIIAIDQALPYWRESFSDLGEVRPFAGRKLRPEDLHDVDALVVRTVTPVNAALLEGSSVRFVGAASAGMDHIDQAYLRKKGIHFCYAAGCNADAVSEYILAALHTIAARKGWTLAEKSLAVIGVGNVGSRVARKAGALGMNVRLCDPPLHDATGDTKYQSFEDMLDADVLTFHVPLTASGLYPTHHLLNHEILSRLAPHQLIINSSRGEVVDNAALARALRERSILGAVLDVWEDEPEIDYDLLALADIGTPHVAGTTLDGKIKAVTLMRERLCEFLRLDRPLDTTNFYPETQRIYLETENSPQQMIAAAVRAVYDIEKDDAELRTLAAMAEDERGKNFEQLRTGHFLRPECHHYMIELDSSQRELADMFVGIGFKLAA